MPSRRRRATCENGFVPLSANMLAGRFRLRSRPTWIRSIAFWPVTTLLVRSRREAQAMICRDQRCDGAMSAGGIRLTRCFYPLPRRWAICSAELTLHRYGFARGRPAHCGFTISVRTTPVVGAAWRSAAIEPKPQRIARKSVLLAAHGAVDLDKSFSSTAVRSICRRATRRKNRKAALQRIPLSRSHAPLDQAARASSSSASMRISAAPFAVVAQQGSAET